MRNLFTLIAFSCAAVAQTTPAPAHSTGATHKPAAATAKAADATQTFPADPGLYAAFNTSQGRIVVKLYEKEAPITVKNFVALARGTKPWTDPKTGARVTRPFYNGVTFHRVIPDFMIQGGDPTGTGAGDGGVPVIADEFNTGFKFDGKGRLAMANTGQPRSQATQFFITDAPYPSLDGKYSLFGQVVDGQEVVTKIAGVPRDANDKPTTPVVIKTLVIRRVGPPPAPAVKKPATSSAKTATKM
jgi:peptidyl-prolyl cis-trans isomerase A (cyclophilin A)